MAASGPPPPTAITERVIIPVKGGVEDWKEPYKQLLLTLKDQPGYIRTRWGPRIEDPQTLDLMIGWVSPEAKNAFVSSDAHSKSMEQMGSVLNGKPWGYTIKFKPYAPREAINSPSVEMITIRNCTGNEDELKATIEKAFSMPGSRGGASGFSTQDVEGHGKVFVGAIGWDSIEASKAADKSAYIPNGAGDVEVDYVNYNFPIKGFSVTNSN
ncbi:hypothetical protein DHEL01_v204314 [Diaporthe helianthi]|uniref:ABM domain-containing protein n=1 Tax=Diaporthe helianthi TaxID=158607 RepID=A0A2P5I468_DIAHE|nr:hypothetical protein DHEL01_v204314 [Diaporthe helianthi]